jgi:16S rRNA (guanine527-N7)-methyltransferase
MNLVGDAERLYSRHLLDCLMLETLPWPPPPLEILDVGSGAGLPGIVAAVMHSDCRVVSVESVAKKVTFQRVAAQALALENFLPRQENIHRLAEASEERGRYDLMLARAFSELKTLLELGAALLRPGGELWAMKGVRLAEEQAALPADVLRPFQAEPVLHPYAFPEPGGSGVVAVYRKLERPPTGA